MKRRTATDGKIAITRHNGTQADGTVGHNLDMEQETVVIINNDDHVFFAVAIINKDDHVFFAVHAGIYEGFSSILNSMPRFDRFVALSRDATKKG